MKLLDLPGSVGVRAARLLPLWGRLRIPLLVGVLIAAAFYYLHWRLSEHETTHVYFAVEHEAARLRSDFSRELMTRVLAMRRMATRWESEPQPDRAAWEADAARLMGENLQFRAFLWIEPSMEIRWTTPFAARLPGSTLDPRDDGARLREIEAIGGRAQASVTRSVLLSDGRREILVCAPMFSGGPAVGTLVGVIRLRDLLDAILEEEVVRGYAITVYEGPYHVFGPLWAEAGPEAELARDADFLLDDISWRIQVWPSPVLLRDMRTDAKALSLALGLTLALVVAVVLDRAQTWKRRAREAAGRELRSEGDPTAPPSETTEPQAGRSQEARPV